ncbi:hypothetical protein [Stackebrandtia nassauensis]|uniref:Uncharacterized protein n=1 Tax=Stackebrandtia nassauensis (strain DSM 44728 / CIP 108903 / NRRL B-16338 / NBRC 102104 / LLR-40K-21) TaxID=446470 RepID=D3Q4Q1_STANL|nr:hypothetical protein [Stackebrandtia nassauensis]ADD42081.1 hypothetical protein Snas_2398 [Stackebrandtia nassauensis DSM 44728]
MVRVGSSTATVGRTRLIGPAKVENFGVRFKVGEGFRDEVTILAGRRNLHREDLLAQLNAFDWPMEYT